METYISKVDQFDRNEGRLGFGLASSERVSLSEQTLHLLAGVSQSQVDQIVKRFSSMTRRQQNCMKVREFLEIFPSTPSYYSSFWNFNWNPFRQSDPHDEMKSYRTMAYNILTTVAHAASSTTQQITQKVAELRQMKMLYFKKYYRANPNEDQEKEKNHQSGQQEIDRLEAQIKAKAEEMNATERDIKSDYARLRQFVQSGSSDKDRLQALIDEIERLRKLKSRIELASTEEEVIKVTDVLQNKHFFDELRLQLRLASDYSRLIESLDFIASRPKLPETTKKLIQEQVSKMNSERGKLEDLISKRKKHLASIFERNAKKNEDLLKGDQAYRDYKSLVQGVIGKKRELNQAKDQMTKWKVQIEQKKLRLESFDVREFSDFVIPPQFLFNLKGKLEQMKQIFTFDGSKRRGGFGPKDKSEDQSKHSVRTFRETLESTQSVVRSSFDADVRRVIDDTAKQLYLIATIEDHEKELDEIFGQVFAEIFEMEDGMRCFSMSQLSYLFFNLFKTNTVSNQHRFLIVFLGHLPFSHAQEFILYNLSLFSNKEYIDSFQESFGLGDSGPGEVLRQEKEYISQFAVNYISVVDFYKELTEFKDPSLAVQQGNIFMKVWRSVGLNLGQMLLHDITEYTLEEIIRDIVKRVVKLIPFISSVPFLDFVAGFLVWRITKFLTEQFMKLFSRFIPIISEKMASIIESFQNKNYNFDYQKIINDELNPESPGTSIKLSYQNLDQVYYDAYTRHSDLFQLVLENSRFFKPRNSERALRHFQSNLDFFNQFVLGELILERFFEAGVPVRVSRGDESFNLSQIHDYALKTSLFDSVYSALSTDPRWKSHFFDLYQGSTQNHSHGKYKLPVSDLFRI